MNALSSTEENYLKTILLLSDTNRGRIPNQAIADALAISPATVTEMLRRLSRKRLIEYSRSKGARLTPSGRTLALQVVRKHRLWETFLVQKLSFTWDEVHTVAEQMEHLQSEKLIDQLDALLGHPQFDPHGEPIPDKNGRRQVLNAFPLADGQPNRKYRLIALAEAHPSFFAFLNTIGLTLNDSIEIIAIHDFDKSMVVALSNTTRATLSREVSRCLLVI
jgi:DtxR family transcriptional regulator, Mn-dependent transcriptional regulator